MNKNVDIEEMIADARAEEEVAREQEKAASDRRFKEELEANLKDAFSESLKARRENKVTIDLDEYLILKFKERDLEKILNTLVAGLELGYNKEYLRISNDGDDELIEVFKVLYTEAYDTKLAEMIAENEGE